jgi:hypothetical protein
MKKRYQVFVSSTYLDLKEERQAVLNALHEMGCFVSGMEFFPASPHDPLSFIKREIDVCDYYILIVAGRYGTCLKNGTSYTEEEYLYAKNKDIPILVFLHNGVNGLPPEKTDAGDPSRMKRLLDFRTALEGRSTCSRFETPDELARKASESLHRQINENPRGGWVRAEYEVEATESEVLALREKVESLENEKASLESRFKASLRGEEDEVSVQYAFVLQRLNNRGLQIDSPTIQGTHTTTWGELYSMLSPRMMTTVLESDLQRSINTLLGDRLLPSLRQTYAAQGRVNHLHVKSEQFDTIVVQLHALGLVDVVEREGNRFYRLTQKGEARMLALRPDKKE